MIGMWQPLVLFFYSLIVNLHAAAIVNQCGVYSIEGYLSTVSRAKSESLVLIVEKDTASEIRIDLGNFERQKYDTFLGLNINIDIRLNRRCNFQCVGQVVKINNVIEPFREPRIFVFPPPIPKIPENCSK